MIVALCFFLLVTVVGIVIDEPLVMVTGACAIGVCLL